MDPSTNIDSLYHEEQADNKGNTKRKRKVWKNTLHGYCQENSEVNNLFTFIPLHIQLVS